VWNTEKLPAPGETRIGTFTTGPGGKGFNQAVASHRQGVKTCFLGAIGDDALGFNAQKIARDYQLACEWEVVRAMATGAASVVVSEDGENQIVVALGANERLSPSRIRRRRKLIASAKVVLCQLETDLETVREAFAIARTHGVLCVLNPAPFNRGLDAELIRAADVLTPNETEFAQLIEHMGGNAQLIAAAKKAAQLPDPLLHELCRTTGIKTIVITLGARGVFVSHADPLARRDMDKHYRLPAEKAKVVDTTGAGDAFNGGLAAGMILYHFKYPFRRAVEHALRVAALACEKPGAAPARPTRAQVRTRFRP
jgi:ribokinase